jgi:hypothetical protein
MLPGALPSEKWGAKRATGLNITFLHPSIYLREISRGSFKPVMTPPFKFIFNAINQALCPGNLPILPQGALSDPALTEQFAVG